MKKESQMGGVELLQSLQYLTKYCISFTLEIHLSNKQLELSVCTSSFKFIWQDKMLF